jgi:hypothetical protein
VPLNFIPIGSVVDGIIIKAGNRIATLVIPVGIKSHIVGQNRGEGVTLLFI